MMNDELTKLLISKFDKVDSRLDTMSETLVRNTVSLEEHVKRTNLLEEVQAKDREAVAKRIKPLEKFVIKAKVAGALIVGAGAVLGAALEILSKLHII